MPFIHSKWIYPALIFGAIALILIFSPHYFRELLDGEFSDNTAAANANAYLFAAPATKVATILFWLICIALSVLAFRRNFSLIPMLGLTTCLYLLTGMSASNWKWFSIWFGIGLVVYFLYGYRNSKLVEAPHGV
jgi:hypothetical protein